MIKAPAGYTFAIVDLSQIEPRVLHWLAGDTKMLEHIRQCPDFYEAQARAMGLWSGDEPLRTDPKKRHLIKGLNLGLGYGMGAKKFASVANIPSDEAERLTRLYRTKNPLVTKLWKDLEEVLRSTATSKEEKNAEIEMPSGRKMTYRNVSVDHGGLTAQIPRQGKFMRLGFWGGVVTENLVQATARDVFMDCCLRIEAQGFPVLMRIHDEVVCQVPAGDEGKRCLDAIVKIMSTAPDWAEGLPLSAEGSLSDVYKK
jgi:DNA polymerase